MIEPEVEFVPPPEAPVFEPTWEEFQDPLGYIAKIRPIAERTGICKVKPPPDWQPPFAVDVESFRFTPRVQRLNELEAKTRIKLQFLDQLCKFWELQGSPLRIPCVERKYLDLYLLRTVVIEEGGFEDVCRERKWSKIAGRMSYPLNKGVGSTLRNHYEKILFPFDVFKAGALVDPKDFEEKPEVEKTEAKPIIKDDDCFITDNTLKEEEEKLKKDVIEIKDDADSEEMKNEGDEGGGMRRSIRIQKEPDFYSQEQQKSVCAINKELAKLQFFGAGPKAAVIDPDAIEGEESPTADECAKKRVKTRDRKGVSYIDTYMCNVCSKGDDEHYMLLCDSCDDAFHTYCLIPPLEIIPKGDWRCPRCVAKECNRPKEAYGFAQAKKEYSLQTFGEMADQFKLDYFNMPVHMVPCSTVEKEFWRLVSCIEEDVIVEYGADVHALEMGSGFPTERTQDQFPDDEEYISSGWNLNVLPLLEKSVLKHISGDISGMKVPWCYVGMCFSSFCWHIEDHWSYSINYLHWGEPKTWYGVPGVKAPLLEECMKKNAPELFEQSPDLLHQLTTIMNPNILMSYGVPIVRTNQHAGEFVITFPRAYHAGFNQGYNFAEAVNFCPADWMSIGRNCVEHYRMLHKQCVFSHEELVCKMAANPDQLDLGMAAAVHGDMLLMVESEKNARKALLDRGTTEAEREAFELLPDDERQCAICKTTCFLSALTCRCSPNKLVCMVHMDKLCACAADNHCLRYRYTLDELPAMLHRLKVRAESFDNWAYKVKSALEAPLEHRLDIRDLRDFVCEATENKFPDSPLLQSLEETIAEAEKCAAVANQLVSTKVRTRCRQSGDSKYQAKLSLDELEAFNEQMSSLPCKISEAELVNDLLQKVLEFQKEAVEALDAERPHSATLDKLLEAGVALDVDLPEMPKLKQLLNQAKWLDQVEELLADRPEVTLEKLRKLIESGVGLVPHPACEKSMAEVQQLLTRGEQWEEKARVCLQSRPRHMIAILEGIIDEAHGISVYLPNVEQLKDAVKKGQEWITKVEAIQNSEHYPYLDILENVLNKGRPIPVRLDLLPQLESQVSSAKSWRERTARTFLKKNSTFTLVEVLSPRPDVGIYYSGKTRRKKLKDGETLGRECMIFAEGDEQQDPATIVAQFKTAEVTETEMMRELRTKNIEKEHNADLEVKYCICRRIPSGLMLQCELCKDWFHSACVPIPKSANIKGKASMAAAVQAAKDLKFLCPLCLRSRRPRLETILSLLVSLQKLPVRLPEGEALQCLTERAMAWQDRARQALATDELSTALAKLSVFSQRMVEAAAREKTEKIISAELMKAANNPELQQNMTPTAFGDRPSQPALLSDEEVNDVVMAEHDDSEDTHSDIEMSMGSPPPGMEHAYSSVSKPGSDVFTVGGGLKKHVRKSALNVRHSDAPIVKLSELSKEQLEELMMEGDLLEVSLDETQHIWKIIQAASAPPETTKALQFSGAGDAVEMEMPVSALDMPEKKKKKKRKDGDPLKDTDKIKKKKLKFKDGMPRFLPKDGDKKRRKKKKDGKEGVGGGYRRNEKGVIILDEEEDVCSALKCLRPTGEEVSWVQCDRCEEWFHMICIGVAEEEISENEDYICFQCRNPRAGKRPALPPPPTQEHRFHTLDTSAQNQRNRNMSSPALSVSHDMRPPPRTFNTAESMAAQLRQYSNFDDEMIEEEEYDDEEDDEDLVVQDDETPVARIQEIPMSHADNVTTSHYGMDRGYPPSFSRPMSGPIVPPGGHYYKPFSQQDMAQFNLPRADLVRQSVNTLPGVARERIPSPVQDAALTMVQNLAAGANIVHQQIQL